VIVLDDFDESRMVQRALVEAFTNLMRFCEDPLSFNPSYSHPVRITTDNIKYRKKRLFSSHENNLFFDNIEGRELFSPNENNLNLSLEFKLMMLLDKIFTSKSISRAFMYFCKRRAATIRLLEIELKLPTATTHRSVNSLYDMGLIDKVTKLPKQIVLGGPKPKVWGLTGFWTDEDVARCINLHYRSTSPKYLAAEEVAQEILDSYLKPRGLCEIDYKDVFQKVKAKKLRWRCSDVADLTATCLSEKGVKVWR
jgi:hypothetical protein